jgi:hypothetical protein
MRLFKKLLMISRRGIIFIILIPIFLGCSGQNNKIINIVFDKPPTLKKEQEFISNISSLALNKNLSKFLKDQNWINSFLIKKHAFKPIEIFIETKEPQYIWREKFYLDKDLSKFLYFEEHPHLLHLYMPIEMVGEWLKVQDQIYQAVEAFNLEISSVTYTEAEGWYFQSKNNLRVNLGSNLSSKVFKKLLLTLKYIFEKNLTPSIIDLRYEDGAALNYGK